VRWFHSTESQAKFRPILLGTERYFAHQDDDLESELPVHPEEEQVAKDTNRSFVSYPRGQLLLFAQVVDETDIRYPTRIQDGDEGRFT
jgi:hypothetical protein